jgi:hypothetical protein
MTGSRVLTSAVGAVHVLRLFCCPCPLRKLCSARQVQPGCSHQSTQTANTTSALPPPAVLAALCPCCSRCC